MDFFVRFIAPQFLYICVPLCIAAVVARATWHRPTTWQYPLSDLLARKGFAKQSIGSLVINALYGLLLFLLMLFIAKPQLVDERSLLPVQGIDIVLVLDVSGSMQFVDDKADQRSRFDVAKDEAIRFVQKRDNDAIGLVIFGNDALTRSPITHDKKALEKNIEELRLGFLDPDGTVLATGMVAALNRLRYSKAKSKIMIVLTDGEPSDNDQKPEVPLEIAKQMGIKIYTIGIGSDKPQRIMHPMYGIVMVPTVNKALLERIAHETSGQYFQAKNPKDMRQIYDTIDMLEKDEHDVPIFTRYYELFALYGYVLFVLLFFIAIASTFVWFSI